MIQEKQINLNRRKESKQMSELLEEHYLMQGVTGWIEVLNGMNDLIDFIRRNQPEKIDSETMEKLGI